MRRLSVAGSSGSESEQFVSWVNESLDISEGNKTVKRKERHYELHFLIMKVLRQIMKKELGKKYIPRMSVPEARQLGLFEAGQSWTFKDGSKVLLKEQRRPMRGYGWVDWVVA